MGDVFDRIAGKADEDVFDRVASSPTSVADEARARLKSRGIDPKKPVDAQLPKQPSRFNQYMDSLHDVANGRGPNPWQYALSVAKGSAGLLPALPLDNAPPAASAAMEGANIARRIEQPKLDFNDDPWRRRIMQTVGAVPVLGEPAQNFLKPSLIAPERPVTDEERLDAVEGAFTLGSLAAGKARGVVPDGGEWANADPTKGARTKLSAEVAPQINRNLLKPKKSQMQFGADPGEFTVGMKTTLGDGIESLGPQIEAKLTDLNATADQIAFNTPEGRTVPIDYEGALRNGFAKHITEAMRDGNAQMATRLQSVLDNEIAALHGVTGGAGVAPARVGRRYHQDLGYQVGRFQAAGKAGVADPADGTIRAARQDAWAAIKHATNEAVPGLKDVNEQLHSGIEAQKALHDRVRSESVEDPLTLNPLALARGAYRSPWFRTRLASGMRSLAPVEQATPPTLPNEAVPWRPGVRRPANEQRALPPAPEGAPGGFVSSNELRRVGVRLGQTPAADAAVFAPQNVTRGMAPSPVTGSAPPLPEWFYRASPVEQAQYLYLMRQMGAQ